MLVWDVEAQFVDESSGVKMVQDKRSTNSLLQRMGEMDILVRLNPAILTSLAKSMYGNHKGVSVNDLLSKFGKGPLTAQDLHSFPRLTDMTSDDFPVDLVVSLPVEPTGFWITDNFVHGKIEQVRFQAFRIDLAERPLVFDFALYNLTYDMNLQMEYHYDSVQSNNNVINFDDAKVLTKTKYLRTDTDAWLFSGKMNDLKNYIRDKVNGKKLKQIVQMVFDKAFLSLETRTNSLLLGLQVDPVYVGFN